jgi:hypothetical protein
MSLKLTSEGELKAWNAPELLDENGDTGPSAQTHCPFRSTADRQTATHMINGDMPSK